MIYVARGCGELCTLPCRACESCLKHCGSCSEACASCSKGCEQMFGYGCGSLCATLLLPLRRPFGGYVLLSVVFGVPTIFHALRGLVTGYETTEDCGHDQWLSISYTIFGFLHIAFSLYLQNRLVVGVVASAEETPLDADVDLSKRASAIVLYDLGFCTYFFVFGASVCLSWWGWVSQNSECASYTPSVLLILYGFFAGTFAFCWLLLVTCCGLAKQIYGEIDSATGSAVARVYAATGQKGTQASTTVESEIPLAKGAPSP
eukprot:TRINITY_DN13676_c0_g1_i1.p1 TRINITY_DN13676_c0_g1~~TRINITY_DN13676_c0_g1_i1.p1  ORF type:complete len:261 (+),score=10.40 TRINITY_DN13676_c0_g1_i1:51-833(+)